MLSSKSGRPAPVYKDIDRDQTHDGWEDTLTEMRYLSDKKGKSKQTNHTQHFRSGKGNGPTPTTQICSLLSLLYTLVRRAIGGPGAGTRSPLSIGRGVRSAADFTTYPTRDCGAPLSLHGMALNASR